MIAPARAANARLGDWFDQNGDLNLDQVFDIVSRQITADREAVRRLAALKVERREGRQLRTSSMATFSLIAEISQRWLRDAKTADAWTDSYATPESFGAAQADWSTAINAELERATRDLEAIASC